MLLKNHHFEKKQHGSPGYFLIMSKICSLIAWRQTNQGCFSLFQRNSALGCIGTRSKSPTLLTFLMRCSGWIDLQTPRPNSKAKFISLCVPLVLRACRFSLSARQKQSYHSFLPPKFQLNFSCSSDAFGGCNTKDAATIKAGFPSRAIALIYNDSGKTFSHAVRRNELYQKYL